MAASLDDSGLWLESDADLCFPSEFPYDAFSPELSSGDPDSSDDDDFLTGLTRRFTAQISIHGAQKLASEKPEKQWVSGGSPQSTLSGFGWVSGSGSPNEAGASPAATPFGLSNDSWEVIYAAAGEVARLKMNSEAAKLRNQQGRGLIAPTRSFHSHQPNLLQPNQFHQFVKQERPMKQNHADWGRNVKEPWPTHHHHHNHHYQQQQMLYLQNRGCGHTINPQQQAQLNSSVIRPMFHGGAVAKRESTGTGVFLPRNPSDYRKKTSCSPVLVPAKVVQALNLNFNGHAHPRAGGCVAPNHEALIARRNALLVQQRRSLMAKPAPEVYLPQEWTY